MISLGKYSYACDPNILWKVDDSTVTCGKFVSIGEKVTMFLGNGVGHDSNFLTTYPFGEIHQNVFPNVKNNSKNTNGSIKIGNDIWIGHGSTLMSGITIGDGAIIAANSHVIKSVEPYSIVGGNPAKHVKYRFSSEQIKKLLEIKWWDWTDYRINKYMKLMLSYEIDKFIETALSDDTYYFLADEVDDSLVDENDSSLNHNNNNNLVDVTDDLFVDDIDYSLSEVEENSDVENECHFFTEENSEGENECHLFTEENSEVENECHFFTEENPEGENDCHLFTEEKSEGENECHLFTEENSEGENECHFFTEENSEGENDCHLFTEENYSDQLSINETIQTFPICHDEEVIQDTNDLINDNNIYIEA